MLIQQQKNRALRCVCWSHIFHIHTCVNRPLFLHDSCFFLLYYLHLLYKSRKHFANTHWIKSPKLQVVGVGFPLYRTNSFHYCITVTRLKVIQPPVQFTNLYSQPVIHLWAVGRKRIADTQQIWCWLMTRWNEMSQYCYCQIISHLCCCFLCCTKIQLFAPRFTERTDCSVALFRWRLADQTWSSSVQEVANYLASSITNHHIWIDNDAIIGKPYT